MAASLKIIDNELGLLCEAHNQINQYKYGEFLDILKSNTLEYTVAMMNCIQIQHDPSSNRTTYVLDLIVMDKIYKDRSNNNDVENQTSLILSDLIAVIFLSPRWQSLGEWSSVAPAYKFIEKGADVVTGWGVTVNFVVTGPVGYCVDNFENYNFNT